jgi:hypothetical protein
VKALLSLFGVKMIASEETLKEVISHYGAEFGFVSMKPEYCDVLAGEEVLTKIPTNWGVDVLEFVNVDITAISGRYTIFDLMRTRIDKEGRKRNIAQQVEQLKKMQEIQSKEELKLEMIDYAAYLDKKVG